MAHINIVKILIFLSSFRAVFRDAKRSVFMQKSGLRNLNTCCSAPNKMAIDGQLYITIGGVASEPRRFIAALALRHSWKAVPKASLGLTLKQSLRLNVLARFCNFIKTITANCILTIFSHCKFTITRRVSAFVPSKKLSKHSKRKLAPRSFGFTFRVGEKLFPSRSSKCNFASCPRVKECF